MTSPHLQNYLRTHRKRLALSQEDVAFLLGTHGGAKVCRHEMFASEPSLATALAYEAIFQRPTSELFAGLYHQIEAEVAARAKTLTYRIERGKPSKLEVRKRQTIIDIANKPKRFRILGIAPTFRGIGFAVLEGEETLVDYGCKSAKGNMNARCLAKVEKLILQYRPDVIVSKDTLLDGSRRSPPIQELTRQITEMAKTHKIKIELFSFKEVRQIYFGNDLGTKHALAEILANRFPELADRLPPKRRAWTSEDSRMCIFDAASLAWLLRLRQLKSPVQGQPSLSTQLPACP